MTCGSRVRLQVMGDDEFVARINGVRVLEGDDWDEIERKNIDIRGSNYKIVRCGNNGKNTLTI